MDSNGPDRTLDPAEVKTPAYNDDHGGDNSPDVAPDGQAVPKADDDFASDTDGPSWWRRIRWPVVFDRPLPRSRLKLVGIAVVLVGGYNLVGTFVTGGPYLLTAHHLFEPIPQWYGATPASEQVVHIYVGDLLLVAAGALVAWYG